MFRTGRALWLLAIMTQSIVPVATAVASRAEARSLAGDQASVPTGPVSTSSAIGSSGATPVADGDYQLGPADKVRIMVYNEPELSGEFIVNDRGLLSLPLIGDTQAAGHTPRQVIDDVQAKLADGFLRDPYVSMDVLTYRPFYILGEVGKPGEYPFSAHLTVMNAVALASGFTYRANKRRVFIKRAGQSGEEPIPLTADLAVRPGDTVRVGERHF